MDWRPLDTQWHLFDPARPDLVALPAEFETPAQAWGYGAATLPIAADHTVVLRIRLEVSQGVAAVCLLSEDYGSLQSVQEVVAPKDGEAVVTLRLLARRAPARILLRTADGETPARVRVESVEIADDPDLSLDQALPADAASPVPFARYPVAEVLAGEAAALAALRPAIDKALRDIDVQGALSLAQALTLAAAVRHLRPDVIIDLGTGRGGSAAALAMADPSTPVHTFDWEPQWAGRVDFLLGPRLANVHPVVGDIVDFDFAPLLAKAERPLIFWDAHGWEIAARMFSHILPMIADKPHVVFVHDLDDTRFHDQGDSAGSYHGRRMWRGYDDYIRDPSATEQFRLGWMMSGMDQVIALADFATRNALTIESVDERLHAADPQVRARADAVFAEGERPVRLAFFTLNETRLRHFPAG